MTVCAILADSLAAFGPPLCTRLGWTLSAFGASGMGYNSAVGGDTYLTLLPSLIPGARGLSAREKMARSYSSGGIYSPLTNAVQLGAHGLHETCPAHSMGKIGLR